MEVGTENKLREGKAKILYATDRPDGAIRLFYKDDATAFDGIKKGQIPEKGIINNTVSAWIFRYLGKQGISTHFLEQSSERESLVKSLDIIPVEVVIRNVAAGSICKRMGLPKGKLMDPPLVEYFYKDDALHDPLIGETHIYYFDWASKEELKFMSDTALKVNDILRKVFSDIGLTLVDYKLEFGRDKEGHILLGDEFTADGCRLWDKETGESMDKDRFRHDLGNVEEAYQDVYLRLKEYFEGKI